MLAISKLNDTEVLISMALIDSNISHNEFFLIKNCAKRTSWYESGNQKFKEWICLSKILVYF